MTAEVEVVGIVVPARNEEDLLPAALRALDRAAQPVRRRGVVVDLLVVADSCTDATATVARSAAVDVLEVSVRCGRPGAGSRVPGPAAAAPGHPAGPVLAGEHRRRLEGPGQLAGRAARARRGGCRPRRGNGGGRRLVVAPASCRGSVAGRLRPAGRARARARRQRRCPRRRLRRGRWLRCAGPRRGRGTRGGAGAPTGAAHRRDPRAHQRAAAVAGRWRLRRPPGRPGIATARGGQWAGSQGSGSTRAEFT